MKTTNKYYIKGGRDNHSIFLFSFFFVTNIVIIFIIIKKEPNKIATKGLQIIVTLSIHIFQLYINSQIQQFH